jgi:hypothetical protein
MCTFTSSETNTGIKIMATLTLNNIEKEANKVAKKWGNGLNLNFDYGVKGQVIISIENDFTAVTTVLFDEQNGVFEGVYTTQLQKEKFDNNSEDGYIIDCNEELYMGESLTTAINKMRLAN